MSTKPCTLPPREAQSCLSWGDSSCAPGEFGRKNNPMRNQKAVPPCGIPTIVLATAYFGYASTAIDDVLAVGGCPRTACRANERCAYAPVPRSTGPRQ